MVKLFPAHIDPLFTETIGRAITVIVLTAGELLMHPTELVPVTEYEEVVVGLTIAVPEEYVYVLAPLGDNVYELPEQSVLLFTEIIGFALTVIFKF
jgi:hypothetical protein